ncbi:MAG: DUF3153 domain-containing protein [Cyanobacteria bacterium]|nr:DUF3153 domain-containing protein [Cyanobacteriota bacterium]MDA0865697.1 DUF3153 domain-containing protein [Cyanobacteriota bacterium]
MAALLKGLLRAMVLLVLVLVTGCFQYDLDIQFDSQTHGQIVQHLQWTATAAVSPTQLRTWREALVAQVKTVGGQVQWADGMTVTVTVPFNNGAELEQRFNQLFDNSMAGSGLALPSGEAVAATLALTQGNWIFAIRNHLMLTLDLTAIPTGERLGAPILQGVELLTGKVHLTTPWGLHRTVSDDAVPQSSMGDFANQWNLHPGQVNQVEADFWIPSPIGIGAAVIALLMGLGYGLRYRFRVGLDR